MLAVERQCWSEGVHRTESLDPFCLPSVVSTPTLGWVRNRPLVCVLLWQNSTWCVEHEHFSESPFNDLFNRGGGQEAAFPSVVPTHRDFLQSTPMKRSPIFSHYCISMQISDLHPQSTPMVSFDAVIVGDSGDTRKPLHNFIMGRPHAEEERHHVLISKHMYNLAMLLTKERASEALRTLSLLLALSRPNAIDVEGILISISKWIERNTVKSILTFPCA